MANILRSSSNVKAAVAEPLPIDTVFKLPSPPPTWPPGGGFATGEIDLGGLQVRQVTTFQKISTTHKGGPADLGATFLEPSPIPDGFTMLGSYAQPNNQPLFGWVLVAKTNAVDTSGQILKQPTDYSLVSTNDDAHFWLPTPPDGFRAVGLVVTASPEKPALDKIRCVRADFTDEAETESQIWGNEYVARPKAGGSNAKSVLSVGTFTVQGNDNNTLVPLSCLINKNSALSAMPNQAQIEAVFASYAPYIYFHPDEKYLPSPVNWYFSNGALLYKKGEESNPVPVLPEGSNLPQGGTNDGLYWLDLPAEPNGSRVKMGDLPSAVAYLHFKPVLGGSATDIQTWVFYPFNGPAAAKVGPLFKRVELGKIGEHVGDWEHVTLRISNLDGILRSVYFAEHGGGQWVDSSGLEFSGGGGNRFSVYSSRNGHAAYPKAGTVMQGGDFVGLRNDAAKSAMVMDTAARFAVVAGEGVVEPPWLNYYRKWGPTRSYDTVEELKNAGKFLPPFLKQQLAKLVNGLPPEVFGEDGPIGPKMKSNWDGDEK